MGTPPTPPSSTCKRPVGPGIRLIAIFPVSFCQLTGSTLPTSAKHYGLRSSDALPLSGLKGTELCSCVTIHLPSILQKQTVARSHISSFFPSFLVPLNRL